MNDLLMDFLFKAVTFFVAVNITLFLFNSIRRRLSVCDICGKRGAKQIEVTPGAYGLECAHCGALQVLDKETGATLVSDHGRILGRRIEPRIDDDDKM